MQEIEVKQLLLSMNSKIDMLISSLPEWVSLADLHKSLTKKRDISTIRKYVKNHFEPGVQYTQDSENGTIQVRKDAALQTRMHYA